MPEPRTRIDQAVQEAACVVVTEYDKTHLTHDVAYEDVASAIDQLRLVLLGRDHPGLRPEYRALIGAATPPPDTLPTREQLAAALLEVAEPGWSTEKRWPYNGFDEYELADAILRVLASVLTEERNDSTK